MYKLFYAVQLTYFLLIIIALALGKVTGNFDLAFWTLGCAGMTGALYLLKFKSDEA